ncbi:MAG: malonyl-CoA decarboxylase [Alphaproteobacteria bacterium]|nr:MAG: malonyl-CoA decarboxylase [Alphaproteobacteria bacterium]
MTDQSETLIERTLSNLTALWRDIAQSAARVIGQSEQAPPVENRADLVAFMTECLEARGGEVAARMRAAALGKAYLGLDGEGRRRFLEILAEEFAVDQAALDQAVGAYQAAREADDPEAIRHARRALHQATIPPRVKLLMQFNALPQGVKFLVDLRADLLAFRDRGAALDDLDHDLRDLLASWFDTGFLDMSQVTWDSPASLLEKLIAYEAVHEIRSWQDLRNRVDSDRRLFALFHPRMPDEPLAFVEVALVHGIARNIQALLDESAPPIDPETADTAIFYSITNTQKGLRGISFGEYLIKRAVQHLAAELPQVKTFATLSPVPGLRAWLTACAVETIEGALSEAERGGVRALGGSDDVQVALNAVLARPDWHLDPVVCKALKEAMLRLCVRYLRERRPDGQPIDPVARFHLKNGARLEHVNWLGDTSPQGLAQAAGLMVNYRYVLDEIEANHEAYMRDGRIAMGPEVRALARTADEPEGRDPLRRLGLR